MLRINSKKRRTKAQIEEEEQRIKHEKQEVIDLRAMVNSLQEHNTQLQTQMHHLSQAEEEDRADGIEYVRTD